VLALSLEIILRQEIGLFWYVFSWVTLTLSFKEAFFFRGDWPFAEFGESKFINHNFKT
jgi:hypothetical protein